MPAKPKLRNREVLIELLKMRQLTEEQAKVAADLFMDLVPEEQTQEKEETLNDFIRELIERMLMLPVQMFLDRLPEEQRERLRKKINL